MKALKFSPGSPLWLLQHEMRLALRKGSLKGRGLFLLIAGLAIGWLFISRLMFRALADNVPPPPLDDGPISQLTLLIISTIIIFASAMMISQAIQRAVEAIYTRNDLDLLLSSPLPAWRILIVRSTAIAISLLPLYGFIFLPPIFWMGIYNSPTWFASIFALIAMAFGAAGLSMLLVTALFRLIGPKRTRLIAQILSLIIGASIFLLSQIPQFSNRFGNNMDEDELLNTISSLNLSSDALYFLPARAMTGDFPAALTVVLFSAGLFAVGVYIYSQRFITDAAAASALEPQAKQTTTKTQPMNPKFFLGIVRKELRMIQRDPLLLSRIGLQIVYLIPLALIILIPREDTDISLTLSAVPPIMTLLATSLAGALAWVIISAEDCRDLLASSPNKPTAIDLAKIVASVTPIFVVLAIPLLVLTFRAPSSGIWAIIGVSIGALCGAIIGLWRQVPGTRNNIMKARGKGSLAAGLGQSFVGLGLSGCVGLGSFGFPWLAMPAIVLVIALMFALQTTRAERAEFLASK